MEAVVLFNVLFILSELCHKQCMQDHHRGPHFTMKWYTLYLFTKNVQTPFMYVSKCSYCQENVWTHFEGIRSVHLTSFLFYYGMGEYLCMHCFEYDVSNVAESAHCPLLPSVLKKHSI